MNKSTSILLGGMFSFFYILNYLMPLAFGDDYLYAFIWQGNPMYVPLAEDAVRITSLQDLLVSQYSFYHTWSGRVINNTLSQFFVWAGKDVFNAFNSVVCVLLVLEIYWCANKGKIIDKIDIYRVAWLFLFFWAFTPGYPAVALWLVGACHYLWPAVLLTGFIIPYIRKYYYLDNKVANNGLFNCFMLILGIFTGCTNENSVCCVILLLLVFILKARTSQMIESWMYAGLVGLVIGYAILMLAPGNYIRLAVTHDSGWLNQTKLLENLYVFATVLVFQFLLWYFSLRSLLQILNILHVCEKNEKLKRDVNLIKAISVNAFAMSFVMLVSPDFHLRSAFPGTVQLIIVAGILLRIQKEYGINLLDQNAKKFLTYIAVVYFMVSAGFTLQHLYAHHVYNEKILSYITDLNRQGGKEQIILNVEPFPGPSKLKDFLSGFHTFNIDISQDATYWTNVAFARYYRLKGIHVRNTINEKNISKTD